MGQIKQRDYMFDAFRGLLIWCIPISHFTRVAGHYPSAFLGQIVYITINVFVMQAFVFLSGYFSKKPDRARETAFHTFLWPYLLCIPFFFMVRSLIFGHATINLMIPPFALWYLFALFFYRFFLKNYIKIPHIFEISMLIYLVAGLVPYFSDKLALGRMLSYFPFFLIGYYCTEEHLKKLRSLKKWHCAILGAVLVAISVLLAKFATQFPAGYYLLKCPHNELGVAWYWDIIGRMMIFVIACGWIILMLNILPNKKNYLVYVGMNTMPIYILHLIVRYLVKKYGITFGILPDNRIVYYVMIFGLASLCVVVLSSPPVVKLYDFVVEGLYKVFKIILRAFVYVMGLAHIPVEKIASGGMNMIYRLGNGNKASETVEHATENESEAAAVTELTEEERAEKAEAEDKAYDPAMWFKEKEDAADEDDEDVYEASVDDVSEETVDDAKNIEEDKADAETEEETIENTPAAEDEMTIDETATDSEEAAQDDEEPSEEDAVEEEPEMTEEEKAKALEEEKEAYLASLFGKERLAPYVPKETDAEENFEEKAEPVADEPEVKAEEPAETAVDSEESIDAEEAVEEAEALEYDSEDIEEDYFNDIDEAEYDHEEGEEKGIKDKLLSKIKFEKPASIKSMFKRSEKEEAVADEPAAPKEEVLEFAVYGLTKEEVEAIMNIKNEEEEASEEPIAEEE